MTKEEIQKGIALICNTSKEIQNCYESKQSLADLINAATKEDIEKCWEYYKDRTGVIVDVRKELFKLLKEESTITVQLLEELVVKHKEGKENQFRVYKNFYTIFYPAITFYGHNIQRTFVTNFVNQLIKDLGIENKVKTTSFDFQGARQQGSDRYWLAIYNREQQNQSTGLQFFIDFHHGKMSYGIYHHSTKSYIKNKVEANIETFNYDDLLNYFKTGVDSLLNDLPKYDNLTEIDIENHKLYKISHGSFKAKNKVSIIEKLKENNWIILHENTGKDQSRYFKEDLSSGDYVYITLGSKELIGIAKIVSDEWDYVPNEIVDADGWMFREVEFIKAPTRKSPKDLKDSKNIFPSGNSTLTEVKIDLLDEANEKLFRPYFNVEFKFSNKVNLKGKFVDWLVSNVSGGNYFKNQFDSDRKKLEIEINIYEEIYKSEFITELFLIDVTFHKKVIQEINSNVYKKLTHFDEFNKKHYSGRPSAILGTKNYIRFLNEYFLNNDGRSAIEIINEEKMNLPLNQILYGPPGTGKTYNSIDKALKIINEKEEGALDWEDRKAVKKLFDKRIDEGRVVFTTFHQNMSYEDFIEGIKPDEPEKDGDPVIYKIKYGILRNLCVEACFEIAQLREDELTEKVLDFSFRYDKFVADSEEKLIAGEIVKLKIKKGAEVIVDSISQNGNVMIKHIEGNRLYTVSKNRLTKLNSVIKNLDDVNNIANEFKAIIGGSNSSAYWSVLNAIREDRFNLPLTSENRNYTIDEKKEVVQSLSKFDFKNKIGKPFVLIIDEINRGNVSQVFGELITLIEEDKRLGKDEALEVTLPYSQDKFGIPSNLYIIGTMNTADRSVEALDAALRRRFCFEEMPPRYDLEELQNDIYGYKASEVLKTINSRIEKLIDKDHAIGHSYLLNKNKLSVVDSFYKNIIPLLQEYFFGDYSKLGLVLGRGFVHLKEWDKGTDAFADFDDEVSNDFESRNVYEIIDYRKVKDYKIGNIEMTFEKAIKVLMKWNIE